MNIYTDCNNAELRAHSLKGINEESKKGLWREGTVQDVRAVPFLSL